MCHDIISCVTQGDESVILALLYKSGEYCYPGEWSKSAVETIDFVMRVIPALVHKVGSIFRIIEARTGRVLSHRSRMAIALLAAGIVLAH